MKLSKKILIILLCIAAMLVAVFMVGRYGWKLGGFNACEPAGIEQVNMEEDHVRIRGFYPGSFPTGFLGYHAEQVDSTLYVGFKFSALFGIFETGDFDITIPTTGTVTQVVVKSGEHEYTVWPQEDEFIVSEAEATENGMDSIPTKDGAIFFASGVFYYIKTEDVKNLFCALAKRFPGGKIVFDATTAKGLKNMLKTWLKDADMQTVGLYFSVEDEIGRAHV